MNRNWLHTKGWFDASTEQEEDMGLPPQLELSRMSIDLNMVVEFNEFEENKTSLRLENEDAYVAAEPYDKIKSLIT